MIKNLREARQYLSPLALWHHNEWSVLNPGQTIEDREAKMQNYLLDQPIPNLYLAEQDGILLGSAALVENDMDTHPELQTWLASVFVAPEYRRRGIGAELVKHVMTKAASLGASQMYLFTEYQTAFYQRLGWRILSEETYREQPVTVMVCDLTLYGW